MEDAPVNVLLDHLQLMVFVNASMEFSKMDNALHHAQVDGLILEELANNVQTIVLNVQEKQQLAQLVNQVSY